MAEVAATLAGALAAAAQQARPEAGLRFLDAREEATWLPWPEVHARATRAAGALRDAGVRPGDRVVLVLPTAPAFFDAFLGAGLAGAVPVPVYPPVRLGRIDTWVARTVAMLQAVDAALVVTEARIARLMGRVLQQARPRLGWIDAAALPTGSPHAHVPEPDDLALVQFSSGTTVDPKPVALTHRQVLANAGAVLDQVLATTPLDGDPAAAGVCWLPLYHDMGLIGCVVPAMLAPGPLTLIPPERFLARPALWLRAISRWRGTISPAPDFAYALCTERIRDAELDGVDLSSWRMALDGAEPIRPATLEAFAARFARWGFAPEALQPVYGLSEAALAVTATPPLRGPRRITAAPLPLAEGRLERAAEGVTLVSVGPPLPGFEVRIVDEAGQALPEGRVGQIQARGPSVMQGYLDRADQPFVDGWLQTGDLGLMDAGELIVTGRAKDVLVHRGRNHAPQDLEQAADTVPGVRTGCVVAVADLDEGERLYLLAEVREPHEGQADAVLAAVREATGVTVDAVLLLAPGTLPRTSSGKLRRGEALRQLREGTLAPPRAVTPWMLAGALGDSLLGHLAARWGRR